MLQAEKKISVRAFTLVESMIALAILGIVVVAVATMVNSGQESITAGEALSTRDQIASQIEREMQDFSNVQLSATGSGEPGNVMLRNCLGTGPGLCTATNVRSQPSFQFMVPSPSGGRIIAGTQNKPVNYDRRGAPDCTRLSSAIDCPLWQVRAYFYATCPVIPPATTPAASCRKATTVHLRYQVSPTRDKLARSSKDPLIGRKIAARPPNPDFNNNPERYAINHRIGATLSDVACPANSEQVGWSGSGQVQCKCRFGLPQTGVDAQGMPICPTTDMICNPNELLQGVDLNGKPICTKVKTTCKWITWNKNATDARCPNAGWLEAIDLGVCKAAKKSKKANERKITCSKNRGYCCFYEPI